MLLVNTSLDFTKIHHKKFQSELSSLLLVESHLVMKGDNMKSQGSVNTRGGLAVGHGRSCGGVPTRELDLD